LNHSGRSWHWRFLLFYRRIWRYWENVIVGNSRRL